MVKEIKSCLDDLQNSNCLSEKDYKFMKPCECKPGTMYGLCKVHKGLTPNDSVPPVHPISSAIGTWSHNLAKFFAPLLKQYTINEYTKLRTLFLSVKKLLIKILNCLWHLLTFSHCLLIFKSMKQLTFVLIWFTINVKKLKVCSSIISNNF